MEKLLIQLLFYFALICCLFLRLKLSEKESRDVLEEKEIEPKRLEDRHVVMKAEKNISTRSAK